MDAAHTVVGPGAVFDGTLIVESDLTVDGVLRGKLIKTSGTLIIGDGGLVEAGSIEAAEATIRGRFSGRLIASRYVRIEKGAHFSGTLVAPKLILHEGALFEEAAEA